jgi:hypothetical protein
MLASQSVVVDRGEFTRAVAWLRRGRGTQHDMTVLYKDEEGLKVRTQIAETIVKSAGAWPRAVAVNAGALNRLASKVPRQKELTLEYVKGELKVGPTRLTAWSLERVSPRGDQQDRSARTGVVSAKRARTYPDGIAILQDELTYTELLDLADVVEGWTLDPRITPDQAESLDQIVDHVRALATDVGPTWQPPPHSRPLSLLGFIGKQIGGK